MTRNLEQRIEVCAPITDEKLKDELVHYFDIQWNDHVKAVTLDSELHQHRLHEPQGDQTCPQEKVYEYLKNRE
jgi:polyphosphate kinase